MAKPESPEHGLTFDISAITEELRREDAYEREGQCARTLVRTADLRVVLIAMKSGKRLSEHHASATASVHTLSGYVRLQLPDRSVDLPAGQLLVLGGGLRHDVEAAADSTFLLTLGWHGNP